MTTSTNWYTQADIDRFTGHRKAVLETLLGIGGDNEQSWVDTSTLSILTGSKRVASRIDELRDVWQIETIRGNTGQARYRITGKHPEGYVRPVSVKIDLELLKRTWGIASRGVLNAEQILLLGEVDDLIEKAMKK